jgi:hypothetical protein
MASRRPLVGEAKGIFAPASQSFQSPYRQVTGRLPPHGPAQGNPQIRFSLDVRSLDIQPHIEPLVVQPIFELVEQQLP